MFRGSVRRAASSASNDSSVAEPSRALSTHTAFQLHRGPGASNRSIEDSRTRAAEFLGLAMVAVSSIAVLYWDGAWKRAATQGEGVVERSTDGSRPDRLGVTQDLI